MVLFKDKLPGTHIFVDYFGEPRFNKTFMRSMLTKREFDFFYRGLDTEKIVDTEKIDENISTYENIE